MTLGPHQAVMSSHDSGRRLTLQFIGPVAPEPEPWAGERAPLFINYYTSADPANWRSGVPTYSKVGYRNVYDGIDVLYYGNGQQLEYDIVVRPGANPAGITTTSLAPIRANSAGISTLPTYTIVNLGTLGGYNSEAYDINESGVTVGTTRTAAGLSRAFLYENGVMTDLGFPGDLYSVNESGQFAGMRSDQAIFFDGTQLIDLSLPNSYYSVAFATNDAAQVTGTAFVPGGYEAFLYESGVRTTLPSAGGDYTAAYDINQAGVVTGEVYLPGNQESRTALWHDGVLTTLQPPGSPHSYRFAINNAGEVAITGGDTTSRGFLYSNGTFTPDTRGE